MARKKSKESEIKVGHLSDVSGSINISGQDIVHNIQTIYERALTASEVALQERNVESQRLAQGVSWLAERLRTQAGHSAKIETPYKGLLPYSLHESDIFYGRVHAIRELISATQRSPLTILHSDASLGKSSLLQAGLAAALTASGHLALPVRSFDQNPVDVIKRMFLPDLTGTPVLAAASLQDFLREVCNVLGAKLSLYLLLDQFEEFFVLLEKAERKRFVESLATCLNDPSLPVRWVLAVRSESLSGISELESAGVSPFQNTCRLYLMSRSEAREAITGPAGRFDIDFEPQLVEHILDSLAIGGEIGPTQLQLVCSTLADHLPEDKKLTLHQLQQEGGVEGVFRNHLKRQLDHLAFQERVWVMRLLQTLVSSDRRRLVKTQEDMVREIGDRDLNEKGLNNILERLVIMGLLSQVSSTPKRFELAHDYVVGEIVLEPQVIARKAAQELLEQEVRTFLRFGSFIPEERLAVINSHREELWISTEAKELLEASQAALDRRRLSLKGVLQNWLSPSVPRTTAPQQPVERKSVRRMIEVPYKKHALVIGNTRYDDRRFAPLTTPQADVSLLADILRDPGVGGFVDVQTLVDRPSQEIEDCILDFCLDRKPDELMILYFSGHGVLDAQGRLYLAACDTRYDRPQSRAIKTQFITENMDESRCKRQILILDCCHSGAFHRGTKGGPGRQAISEATFEGKAYGRVVLTATNATQYAWENDQMIGDSSNSVFTHYMIQGLRDGSADLNQDGWVTVDELYKYIYNEISAGSGNQTPEKWTYRQEGDLYLAHNPGIR